MNPTWSVLCGDAREKLGELVENSVQMFFTSPPYWGLRRYLDHPDEIGREPTLDEWVANLVEVFRAAKHSLRDDGTLWINCGDSWANDAKGPRGTSGLSADHWQLAAQPPGMQKGWRTSGHSLKRKDLLGLPYRLAFALQEDGWYWRAAIPWCKGVDWMDSERAAQETIRQALATVRQEAAASLFGVSNGLDKALRKAEKAVDRLLMTGSAMPNSVTDRPAQSYEMILLFSQQPHYYYDHHAIRVPSSTHTNNRGNKRHTPKEADTHSRIRANSNFHEHAGGKVFASRNARTVWMFPWRIPVEGHGKFKLPSGKEIAHFAAFPEALPARAIKAGTSEHGCCATCYAPYKRVIEPTPEYAKHLGKDWSDPESDQAEGRGHFDGASQRPVKRKSPAVRAEYITTGWEPTCDCPLGDIIPCTIGDMFGGSAQTGRAARRLNRSSVMIDLNPDYCELMEARIGLYPLDVEEL